MLTIIDILLKVVLVIFCTTAVYFSGELMIRISDKHPDKEWINSIIAFIDLLIIIFVIILSLQTLFILIPFILIILTIIIITDIIIYGIIFVVLKIKNNLK